jgi:hypothetical protein
MFVFLVGPAWMRWPAEPLSIISPKIFIEGKDLHADGGEDFGPSQGITTIWHLWFNLSRNRGVFQAFE